MAKKLSLSGPAGIVAIVTSVMLTLVSVLLAAGFTVLLGYTLAQAFSGKSISGQLGGLFFLAIGVGGCESLRVAIEQRCQLSEQGALQSRLLWHIFRIGPGILAQRRVGSLIDMMTAGTEKIERYRQGFLGSMIGSMLTPPLVLVLMALFIDPICALVLLAFVPLVPLIIFVFSKLIIDGAHQRVRQVLLLDIVVRVVVRILVKLPFVLHLGSVEVLVLQAAGKVAHLSGADICHRAVDCHVGGVGLGCGCHGDHCLCQRDACLGQSQLKGAVYAGFDDDCAHRVRHADILTGNHQQTAAGRNQVARLQQPCQIVQGGVFV